MALGIGAAVIVGPSSEAATIYVTSGTFNALGQAIESSASGDTLLVEPGTYLWSSPHGYQFLRNHEGTVDVTVERHCTGCRHRERD